jgi:Nrap protein PAP/OAS-like domain
MDTCMIPHLNYLHKAKTHCEAFADACMLGKIWLRQRGLTDADAMGFCMNGFLFSMIMAWLCLVVTK